MAKSRRTLGSAKRIEPSRRVKEELLAAAPFVAVAVKSATVSTSHVGGYPHHLPKVRRIGFRHQRRPQLDLAKARLVETEASAIHRCSHAAPRVVETEASAIHRCSHAAVEQSLGIQLRRVLSKNFESARQSEPSLPQERHLGG